MDKKRAVLFTSVSIIMLLTLSVKYAYSSTDENARSEALTFLKEVANLNINDISIISFNVSTPEMLNSEKAQTVISAIISYNDNNYSLAMVLIEGKVWFYELDPLSAVLGDTDVSLNYCLNVARRAISGYKSCFNASHVNGFAEMIPTAIQTRDLLVDNGNKMLNISFAEGTSNQSDYASFSLFKEVNGVAIPQMSTTITISKTGVVTSFHDNLGLYTVASTKVAVSKEEAIATAMPYFETYADENGQTVKTVEATLEYTVDSTSSRGDSHSIYPQWKIFAELEGSNEYGINEYGVMMWADNGEVYHYGPQGFFRSFTAKTSSYSPYLLAVVIFAVVASSGLIVHLKRQRTQKKNKVTTLLRMGGVLTIVSLLCSLSMPLSYAWEGYSYQYGSRWNVDSTEQGYDRAMVDAIYWYSQVAYYTAYKWYGEGTTAENLYLGAQGRSAFSLTFHIGHGGHSIEWHYWGWPWQWHTHDYVAIREDDGDWVRDNDIWQNSHQYAGRKMVVLWSCHQAEDAMGDMITYLCGDVQEHGMPLAWNHVDTLSFDGYNDPDSSGQVFIGFTGVAPYLSYDGLGTTDAGLMFLFHFYYALLVYGYNVNTSLDLASQSTWAENYGTCPLHDGYLIEGNFGQMQVYGCGHLYV